MAGAETYFLSDHHLEAAQLIPWADLLPRAARIVQVTLFADVVLEAPDGSVHMLEPAAGSCSAIATNEAEFWQRVQSDDEGWQLRALADKCLAAGKHLDPGKCYAFTTLPLFGGAYEPENIWLCPVVEWLSFTGDIYRQTKDLPGGSTITLRVE